MEATRRPRPSDCAALRVGVVGLGAMGETHARHLATNQFCSLSAVASRKETSEILAKELGCHFFQSYEAMLESQLVDALLVATPHMLHVEAVVDALQSGLHVICEKPLAVTCADADTMLGAADTSTGKLTVVSQNRFEPSYRAVKSLLESGELGPVRRCDIIETFWRPDSYYRSAEWRGTWSGEGGGVLLNQAPHVLDRYIWLCGRPNEMTAVCDTVLHDIDVEDTTTLLCRHDSGIQGAIHVSTNECPTVARLEVACDRGQIVVENGAITIHRLRGSIAERTLDESGSFSSIDTMVEQRGGHLLNWSPELLHAFYEDFAEACWNDRPPEVTAEHGRDVVEMINAGHLSSAKKQHVRLPVDRDEYTKFQARMRESEQSAASNEIETAQNSGECT